MERVSPAPETHTEALLSSPEPHPLSAAYRPSGTVWFLLDILVVVVCVVVRELAFVLWVADMHSVWRDIHEGSPVWAPPVGLQFANVSYDISTQSLWQRLRNFWTRFGSLRNSVSASSDPAGRRRILHNVHGMLKPGDMMALLGSSGAGKSTLLDILAGRAKSGVVSGHIAYTCPDHRLPDDTSSFVGYVLQDDRLLSTETVRETLLFSARSRLPPTVASADLISIVNNVIRCLDLNHIADAFVGHPDEGGGISGGERKRLAIGVELVACPRVLILDEPTSGLDSHSTEVVMNVLRDIANAGCIVICSIHQPTTAMYSQFDKVMLLARGGHALYFGKARHALKYFASMPALGVNMQDKWVNPAEILLEIGVGRQDAEFVELSHRFRGSSTFRRLMSAIDVDGPRPNSPTRPLYGSTEATGDVGSTMNTSTIGVRQRVRHSPHEPGAQLMPIVDAPHTRVNTLPLFLRQSPSSWRRFTLLTKRGVRQIRRDPSLLGAQFLLTVAISLVIGGIFYHLDYALDGLHNRTGYLFFVVAYFSLLSMSSIAVLFSEKLTFFRERAAGFYTTAPYFLSKLLCDMVPLRVCPPIAFAVINYYMIDLNPDPDRVIFFIVTLVLVNVAASSLCFVLASVTGSVPQANLLTSLVFVFNILFGGFILTARNAAIDGIMYLSLFNWAWRALMVNEFHGLQGLQFNAKGAAEQIVISGDTWLVNFDVDVVNDSLIREKGAAALCVVVVVCLLGTFVSLHYIQKYVK